MNSNMKTICRKNGAVSLWNILEGRRCTYRSVVPPAVMATLSDEERRRIITHLARVSSRQP
jgi:hypothetical protein